MAATCIAQGGLQSRPCNMMFLQALRGQTLRQPLPVLPQMQLRLPYNACLQGRWRFQMLMKGGNFTLSFCRGTSCQEIGLHCA